MRGFFVDRSDLVWGEYESLAWGCFEFELFAGQGFGFCAAIYLNISVWPWVYYGAFAALFAIDLYVFNSAVF